MFEWSAHSHGEDSFISWVFVPSFYSVRKHCSEIQQLTNPNFPDNWKQTPTQKTPIQTKQQKKSQTEKPKRPLVYRLCPSHSIFK